MKGCRTCVKGPGMIWAIFGPHLKISSNVVFYVSHLLNNTKTKYKDVIACGRKVTTIHFFMHFVHDFVKNLGGIGTFCPIQKQRKLKRKPKVAYYINKVF